MSFVIEVYSCTCYDISANLSKQVMKVEVINMGILAVFFVFLVWIVPAFLKIVAGILGGSRMSSEESEMRDAQDKASKEAWDAYMRSYDARVAGEEEIRNRHKEKY